MELHRSIAQERAQDDNVFLQVIVTYTVQQLADYDAGTLNRAEMDAKSAFDQEWASIEHGTSIETLRVRWLGRENGSVNKQIADLWLKTAPKQSKRQIGQIVNNLKGYVEERFASGEVLKPAAQEFVTALQRVDITLPGGRRPIGAEPPRI